MSDMPQTATPQAEVPKSLPSADQMLIALLASFGKKPKTPAGKKNPPNSKKIELEDLPLHLRWNQEKTGYRNWKATARILQVEEQTCSCCGTVTKAIKDELFELENITAHSVWLRREGFGIEEPDHLPVKFVDLEPRPVSACAHCRHEQKIGLDHVLSQLFDSSPKQLNLFL